MKPTGFMGWGGVPGRQGAVVDRRIRAKVTSPIARFGDIRSALMRQQLSALDAAWLRMEVCFSWRGPPG